MTICLFAAVASAQVPASANVIVSQLTELGLLSSGGGISGSNPAGGSMAVNSNGDVIMSNTYGGQVLLFNGQTGAVTVLGSYSSIGPVTVDSQDNLYIGGFYSADIVKVPYNRATGTYAAISAPTSSTSPAACTGNDTTECNLSPFLTDAATGTYFGVVSIAFDSKGDFFYSLTDWVGTAAPNAIFECNAACLSTGTPGPVLLYQEPIGASPNTTGQLNIGAMAVDPYGDLFFTDSLINESNQGESFSSNLKELAYTTGTGTYATTPTVLYTFTPPAGTLNEEIDGVATDTKGTVYGLIQNLGGIFAFPNNNGAINPANMYVVSTVSGKLLAIDGKGNLYADAYIGGDAIARISVNNLTAPASPVGTATTASNAVTVVLNDASSCSASPTPAVTFAATENGATSTEFVGATTGTCTATLSGSPSFTVGLTLTPTRVGERSAVLKATDAANNSAQVIASGVGQGQLVTLDPASTTTDTIGLSTPESVSVDAVGDLFVADAEGAVYEIAAGTTKLVALGTGSSSPVATALDANGNLYIADSSSNKINEIPNVGTAGGFSPGPQVTLVADSATFGGTALNSPDGLAVGPDGVLYISDSGNNRIVTYNPSSGDTAVRATGLNAPSGVAVDAANTLYVANTGGSNVMVYSGGGAVTTLAPTGVTAPWGVAVDPSGSVLISDKSTGNIVWVPNIAAPAVSAAGLTASSALLIEKNPTSGYGIALDASGDLYTTDATSAAVYAYQRTAGVINFLTPVNDGTNSTAENLNVESAGNTPLATSASVIATLSSAQFTLAAATTDGCANSTAIPTGTTCQLSATFAPALGTASGSVSATSALDTSALNASAASITLNGTEVFEAGTSVTATPTFSPAGGSYTSAQTVILSDATTAAAIYYTTDGSTPTTSSKLYSSPITVSSTETINAIAVASEYNVSAVGTASYTVTVAPAAATPTFSPAAGSYTSAQTVSISDTATGAAIYYTMDGSTPTAGSTLYSSPITVSSTETINAIAVASGYSNSAVGTAAYSIGGTPSFTLTSPTSTVNIVAGGSGIVTFSVTAQNSFSSAVTFSCSGLPTGATCTFSPTTVTPSGTTSETTTLTITAPTTMAALSHSSSSLFPGAMLAAVLCFLGCRKRRRVQILLLLTVSVIGLSMFTGCGGSGSSSSSTTSTVTVTATSTTPSVTQALPLTVTIQ